MTHPGWYIGYVIAFALIWGVVVCVAMVLNLARRIGVQSQQISMAIHATAVQTDPMRDVAAINADTQGLTATLARVRGRLFERSDG